MIEVYNIILDRNTVLIAIMSCFSWLHHLVLQVQLSVFVTYAKACTYYMTLLVLLFSILTNGAAVGQNFWLAHWSNEESGQNRSDL